MIESHCGKATFTSKSVADSELRRIRRRDRREERPIRSYKCHDCGWWHLTSREPMIEQPATRRKRGKKARH